jgi:putative ABC transport system permease protein
VRRYVWRDLVRNPRRTLASLVGVTLGIALFSAVLFFIDGSQATMTERAIAPLALDMQRVLGAPLGGGLRFGQRVLGSPGALREGATVRVALTIANRGSVPANEVVVNDEPALPLTYVQGSTRRNGMRLRDSGGQSPLAQGLARSGMNIGTVRPGETIRLTYAARATTPVRALDELALRATISTRENVVPVRANAPAPLTLERLRSAISTLPGVASADALSFVDLPAGSLRSGKIAVHDPVRLFAFDERYARRYRSIRIVKGSIAARSALLSAEAARTLAARPGQRISLRMPGGRAPLSVPVSGVTDLSRAKPLFSSRKTDRLEDFIYVPNSVVVSPRTFRRVVIPAFRAAAAAVGSQLKSMPLSELDVLVERSRLATDPGRALAQSRTVARSIDAVAPGQDYLIDNLSNTLAVARADAAVGRRMSLFLGLPGAVLAAFLAAYAGAILAGAQRREQANLRIRGAHGGHLRRMLAYRTLVLAGLGSVLGVGLGLASAALALGSHTLSSATAADLAASALVACAIGIVTTALALYWPGHRALRREIDGERAALGPARARKRRRLLAYADLPIAVVVVGVMAWAAAAFDPPSTSVSAGESVTLPSHLLIAPLAAWLGGMAVAVRGTVALASRLRLPGAARFGSPVTGTLVRSIRRRSRSLGTGIAGVGLVVAFGMAIAMFSGTYDAAKAADARFTVGSDLRVVPSVLSARRHPPSTASKLEVPGVAAMTPVVSKLDNAVLIGPHDQDRATLTAIDPDSFARVAALSDAFFAGDSASTAITALDERRALLVNADAADALSIEVGDDVDVLLARATPRQKLETFRVAGLFERFPGFPAGTDLVVGLDDYAAATRTNEISFFLGAAADGSDAGLARAAAALRRGPGRSDALDVETRATALDKEQSSLTALNVRGLVALDSLYTTLMCAAVIAIFVFGLLLQRRREYVALLAQGLRSGELRAIVLGESAVVVALGLVAGLLVGTGMAVLLVDVLRPLFVLRPSLAFPARDIAVLVTVAAAATLVSAVAASAMLRRLRPAELLRET